MYFDFFATFIHYQQQQHITHFIVFRFLRSTLLRLRLLLTRNKSGKRKVFFVVYFFIRVLCVVSLLAWLATWRRKSWVISSLSSVDNSFISSFSSLVVKSKSSRGFFSVFYSSRKFLCLFSSMPIRGWFSWAFFLLRCAFLFCSGDNNKLPRNIPTTQRGYAKLKKDINIFFID